MHCSTALHKQESILVGRNAQQHPPGDLRNDPERDPEPRQDVKENPEAKATAKRNETTPCHRRVPVKSSLIMRFLYTMRIHTKTPTNTPAYAKYAHYPGAGQSKGFVVHQLLLRLVAWAAPPISSTIEPSRPSPSSSSGQVVVAEPPSSNSSLLECSRSSALAALRLLVKTSIVVASNRRMERNALSLHGTVWNHGIGY